MRIGFSHWHAAMCGMVMRLAKHASWCCDTRPTTVPQQPCTRTPKTLHCLWCWSDCLAGGLLKCRFCFFCRMYTCVRSLIFGEDFSSDPVSRVLGLILRKSSGGQLQVDPAMLSQVLQLRLIELFPMLCCFPLRCGQYETLYLVTRLSVKQKIYIPHH